MDRLEFNNDSKLNTAEIGSWFKDRIKTIMTDERELKIRDKERVSY